MKTIEATGLAMKRGLSGFLDPADNDDEHSGYTLYIYNKGDIVRVKLLTGAEFQVLTAPKLHELVIDDLFTIIGNNLKGK